MIQLAYHNEELRAQFEFEHTAPSNSQNAVCLDSIDLVLRQCLNIDEMRDAGSFFTGQKLATLLVSKFSRAISFDSIIIDPTCGAGNLLIECSRQLGVEQGLESTLRKWGKCLRGYDIHQTFIDAAKLRLIFEALSRGVDKDCNLNHALSLLPHIKVADVMSLEDDVFRKATHLAMNPPFSSWASPQERFWKKGKVNAAGVVFEHVINLLPVNCQVSALLPDVLRSGSRYDMWRVFVADCFKGKCDVVGKFSSKADVDVFLLYGSKLRVKDSEIKWYKSWKSRRVLSDYFSVCIGPLVAYREPRVGDLHPFIHPKISPAWGVIKKFSEYRQYSGKLLKPPLVVIRRTSSPTDKHRAVGTVVLGKKLVAIENHMIVVKPKDSSVASCRRLIQILKSQETNEFLNNRIRLRHLTVGVVKQIPMNKEFNPNGKKVNSSKAV